MATNDPDNEVTFVLPTRYARFEGPPGKREYVAYESGDKITMDRDEAISKFGVGVLPAKVQKAVEKETAAKPGSVPAQPATPAP